MKAPIFLEAVLPVAVFLGDCQYLVSFVIYFICNILRSFINFSFDMFALARSIVVILKSSIWIKECIVFQATLIIGYYLLLLITLIQTFQLVEFFYYYTFFCLYFTELKKESFSRLFITWSQI